MEGQNLEFKTEWRDEALKTACAFAILSKSRRP